MNSSRVEVFRLFGFPIRVDFTWLVILFLVTYTLAAGYFPANLPGYRAVSYWGMGFVGAIGLFSSILFHELSHALVARHYRIKIDGITLFIFGGVAEMEDEAATPKVEFLMAGVGPLASFLLAGLFLGGRHYLAAVGGNHGLLLLFSYLGYMNAILAIFNLVPAFPLDGGRMFRSALWAWQKDYNRATRVAAFLGKVFGWGMVVYGGITVIRGGAFSGIWYIMIGFFLKQASDASLGQVAMKKILEATPVASVMETDFTSLNPQDRLLRIGEDLKQEILFTHYPVVDHDRLVGYLSLLELNDLKPEAWERGYVGDMVKKDLDGFLIEPQDNAWEALRRMRRKRISNLFVSSADRLQGIVSLQDLIFFFQNQNRKAS